MSLYDRVHATTAVCPRCGRTGPRWSPILAWLAAACLVGVAFVGFTNIAQGLFG